MTDRYNWPEIKKQIVELLRKGRAEPTFASLSTLLGMPTSTLSTGMKKNFQITAKTLLAYAGKTSHKDTRYQGIDPTKVIEILRTKPRSLSEIADRLDRGRTVVDDCIQQMMRDNYGIVIQENKVSLPPYVPPPPMPTLCDGHQNRIRFAVLSDPHFGSKYIQTSALLRFLKIAHDDYGITRFLWTGDLTAGVGVYRGQANDLYAHTVDDQIDSLCNTIPVWEDTAHILLGGNHDYSFMKANGHNAILAASRIRSDFLYAGFDQVEIPLVEIEGKMVSSAILWHPSGGVPYALSYRGQKFAAEVTREELLAVVLGGKPGPTVRFVFWGHLHVAEWFPYGPMDVMGPGCFEGTNGYLKQKGLRPVIRGLILEADITDQGLLSSTHVHPFGFGELEDDYHAAYNPLLAREVKASLEPVFRLRKNKKQKG